MKLSEIKSNLKTFKFLKERKNLSLEVNLFVTIHFYIGVLCLISLFGTIVHHRYPQAHPLWIMGIIFSIVSIEMSLHKPTFTFVKIFTPIVYVFMVPLGIHLAGSIITPSFLYAFLVLIIILFITRGLPRIIFLLLIITFTSIFSLHEINTFSSTNSITFDKFVLRDWAIFFTLISLVVARLIAVITNSLSKYEIQLQKANSELYEKSITDPLTSLYNKRYFYDYFNSLLNKKGKGKDSIALFILDLDHFKLYNDHYGHVLGDECLKSVSNLFKRCLINEDAKAFRIGGEEFAIIANVENKLGLDRISDKIHNELFFERIEHINSCISSFVTISIGAVLFNKEHNLEINELLQKADEALYEAKNNGRNCTKKIELIYESCKNYC